MGSPCWTSIAVPFVQKGAVGAIGVVTAVAISTTVVDASPLSTKRGPRPRQRWEHRQGYALPHAARVRWCPGAVAALLAWFVFVVLGAG